MSSNLPPGVTEGMIPGNRPEDEAAERLFDALGDASVAEMQALARIVPHFLKDLREARDEGHRLMGHYDPGYDL
jgi:hypothetical protein